MWIPSQAHSLAGGRIPGHHCKFPTVRLGTVSCRRPVAAPALQTRATTKARPRQQRSKSNQTATSNQSSVVLTAPAEVQQAVTPPSASVQPRSIAISIDYTSDAEQALQWALEYVIKAGKCDAENAV